MDYAEALTQAGRKVAEDTAEINPVCRTRLLTHPVRPARSIVFFHGLTSCPRQFEPLGEILHERGWNVLIPRMPFHGYANRMTEDLARLRRRDLEVWALEAASIAAGLGERAIVAGLSVGGACATDVVQHRAGLAGGLIISPLLRTPAVPARWTRIAAWLFGILPNRWRWWDPVLKDARRAPDFSYPRLATRAVSAALGLSQGILSAARTTAPATRRMTLILNENDKVVENEAIRELGATWRAHGADARLHVFEHGLGLPHDVIGAEHPEQQVDLVYPVMLALIEALAA